MEHQEAILFLIMVALILGIGNTYYIARYHIIKKKKGDVNKER